MKKNNIYKGYDKTTIEAIKDLRLTDNFTLIDPALVTKELLEEKEIFALDLRDGSEFSIDDSHDLQELKNSNDFAFGTEGASEEEPVSEKEMRKVYRKAFGFEYDAKWRKQHPLPLNIAYKTALHGLEREPERTMTLSVAKIILADKSFSDIKADKLKGYYPANVLAKLEKSNSDDFYATYDTSGKITLITKDGIFYIPATEAEYDELIKGKYNKGGDIDIEKAKLKYAKQDVALLEKEGAMSIAQTKQGVLNGEHKKGAYTFHNNSGEKLFSGNKKEAIEFVKNSYTVEYKRGGDVSEKILWGVKIGEPDYMEEIITSKEDKIDAAKTWATENGFDRLRVATIDISEKPDFRKTFNADKKAKGGDLVKADKRLDIIKDKFNKMSKAGVVLNYKYYAQKYITEKQVTQEIRNQLMDFYAEELFGGHYDYKKGGNLESEIKTMLTNFDLNDLDPFETMQYNHAIKSMTKEEALQVAINSVEGDYSQLSPKLADIAEKQMPADEYAKGGDLDSSNYAIIGYNKAIAGTTQNKGFQDAVDTARTLNIGTKLGSDIIIVKGDLLWIQARVKGVKLENGKEILYDEYEREYFSKPTLARLRKIMKSEHPKYNIGGDIESGDDKIINQYEGKTPEQVWDMWDYNQRKHFLLDHDTIDFWKDYPHSYREKVLNEKYKYLLTEMQNIIKTHIEMGQYGKGGDVKMLHEKSHYQALPEYNGYKWSSFSNGLHHFVKKEDKGYSEIKASDEDLTNGNIEFMTEHGLSMAKGGDINIDKEHETIKFINEFEAKKAKQKLIDGGINADYINISGTHNSNLKFINSYTFKQAVGILNSKDGDNNHPGWGNFKPGKKVTTLNDLKDGDIILSDNKQFNAKNVVKITDIAPNNIQNRKGVTNIVYGKFVDPTDTDKLRMGAEPTGFAIWYHDLTSARGNEFFFPASKMEHGGSIPGLKDVEIIEDYNHGNEQVVTYKNAKGEYWTAMGVKGKLTDLQIKAKDKDTAIDNHKRWVAMVTESYPFNVVNKLELGGDLPKKLNGYGVHFYRDYPVGSQSMNVVSNGQFKDMVLVTDGIKGDSMTVMSDEPYLKLSERNVMGTTYVSVVPVNIADKAWKMFGGNFVWSSDSRFRNEISERPLPLHDRVESYAKGGDTSCGCTMEDGGIMSAETEAGLNKAYEFIVQTIKTQKRLLSAKDLWGDGTRFKPLAFEEFSLLHKNIAELTEGNPEFKFEEGGFLDSYGKPADKTFLQGYDAYVKRIWEGDGWSSEASTKDDLEKYKADLISVQRGSKRASEIIGTGYKPEHVKRLAIEWLEKMISAIELAIKTEGKTISTNRSNFIYWVKKAKHENLIDEKTYDQLLESMNTSLIGVAEHQMALGGILLGAALGIAGTIGAQKLGDGQSSKPTKPHDSIAKSVKNTDGYHTTTDAEKEKYKKEAIEIYNKAVKNWKEYPSKIAHWDDVSGARKSGKWIDVLMPKEFRHHEKFVNGEWIEIPHSEWENLFMLGYEQKSSKREGKRRVHYKPTKPEHPDEMKQGGDVSGHLTTDKYLTIDAEGLEKFKKIPGARIVMIEDLPKDQKNYFVGKIFSKKKYSVIATNATKTSESLVAEFVKKQDADAFVKFLGGHLVQPSIEYKRGGKFKRMCDKGLHIQTLVFANDHYSKTTAKNWAKKHGFNYGKIDATENTYHLRQVDPEKFTEGSFKTITLKDGVQAVTGCPIV